MATTRRRVTSRSRTAVAEPKTAEDVAAMAPATQLPDGHKLAGELEAIARAAGIYIRALRENGVPTRLARVMVDNWQRSLFATYEGTASLDDAVADDADFEPV